MFAATMEACLESKKAPSNKVVKKTVVAPKKMVAESKKIVKKPAKKSVYENKKLFFEDEDNFDAEMSELDDFDDAAEDINDVETMDDIADDVVVVVDPELDADEISQTADDAQEIINNTEEGEVPTTDEYIGDFTYTCPICGNTFFSEEELTAGDACPVCNDVPDNFVTVGKVAEVDPTEKADETEINDEEPIENTEDEADNVEETEDEEDLELADPAEEKPTKECFHIDESTFNPYLNKFVRENYKNARALLVNSGSINKKSGTIRLECKLVFRSGKSKKVVLKAEGYRPGKCILSVKDDGTFKVESKTAPFRMKVSTVKNVIKCEGMAYRFVTKLEGKRVQIYSAPLMESKTRTSMKSGHRH